jgi:hypothetical protein
LFFPIVQNVLYGNFRVIRVKRFQEIPRFGFGKVGGEIVDDLLFEEKAE